MCFEIISSLIVANLREKIVAFFLKSVSKTLAVCGLDMGACTGFALQDKLVLHQLLLLGTGFSR